MALVPSGVFVSICHFERLMTVQVYNEIKNSNSSVLNCKCSDSYSYGNVTVMLHCYGNVTVMLHCYGNVTVMLHSYGNVTVMLHCYGNVTVMLHSYLYWTI